MITLYRPEETDFSHNGIGVILASKAEVSEELNGAYELELEIPFVYENRRVLPELTGFSVIKAPTPRGPQLFRVYQVKKDIQGKTQVNARHIFYDGLFSIVNSVKATNTTIDRGLKSIYAASVHGLGFNASSDIDGTTSFDYSDSNIVNCLLGEDGLINTLGRGELLRDNFTVAINNAIGSDRGFKIRYRKNLIGLDIEDNTDDMATKVKPMARDTEGEPLYLPGFFINSPNINDYFMPIYGVMDMSDLRLGSEEYPTENNIYFEMRRRVAEFYDNGGDRFFNNVKVNFVLLRDTTEYADFAPLGEIFLGDTVAVIHPELSIEIENKCVKYTYDALLKRHKQIEIGDLRGDFAKATSGDIGKLQTEVFEQGGIVNKVNTVENGMGMIQRQISELSGKVNSHAHTGIDGTRHVNYNDLTNRP